MDYRKMGKTGLQLSTLSFGSWVTFHKQIDDRIADELMGIAYDAGVNFFDNAEVYAAGEAKIVGADSRSLCRAIRLNCSIEPIFVDEILNMAAEIISIAKDGDVVLCMGAGSINATPRSIVYTVQHAHSLENKSSV